jgi:hypothetical protein
MIEIIFTLDYEIYGNGKGSLRELVYEPAERLKAIFERNSSRFVIFVEAAELEMIEAKGADSAIDLVKQQLGDFRSRGYELGLHLHPQWYNARYKSGEWLLDYDEYNLCTLSRDRIGHIVGRSVDYLRKLLGAPNFAPISFRAGNWLLQPTRTVAAVLTEHGIKVDSSVYKGGLQHAHKLDYRTSRKNGYYWRFSEDVNVPDSQGILLEIPSYSEMVPIWKMFSSKRIGLQRKGPANAQHRQKRLARLRDFSRLRNPMKLDFCRLTLKELVRMLDKEKEKDQKNPGVFRPIVAIGHTKDLIDINTVNEFLLYLQKSQIEISTFNDISRKIQLPNLKAGE